MRNNKYIFLLAGVLLAIGLILMIVSCENSTAPNTEQEQQQSKQTGPTQNLPGKKEAADANVEYDNTPFTDVTEEDPKTLTVGKPYSRKLVEDDSINILIIGEDKLNDLYDTIGIASINKKNKTLRLIMIPRDTYIEYNRKILKELESVGLLNAPGVFKINFSHGIGRKIQYSGRFQPGSISFLAEVVEEKFGIHVDDYVKINLKGFVTLIDHLDGVDINVPYDMNYDDAGQDLHIHIEKGQQRLYGSDAEGFVRFRQGYKEDGTAFEIGDIGRKNNQIYFMKELIKQKGTLKNIGKIPGIIDLLGKNVQHSIGVGDILQTYIGIATNIITDKYEITSENLNTDKMIRINGASYLDFE